MDTHIAASLPSVADGLAPISRQIWDAKYRFKGPDGTPIDATIEDSWRRVARALAEAEAEPARWEGRFAREAKSSNPTALVKALRPRRASDPGISSSVSACSAPRRASVLLRGGELCAASHRV